MLQAIVHDKVEIINLCIAIVCAVAAGWLSVTARVKAALIGAGNARNAMIAAQEKLKDSQRDIVSLRRQLAQVVAENEELSGRLFLSKKPESTDWEQKQNILESVAEKVDASVALKPAPKPERKPIRIESNKLIFRKHPIEIDPADSASDKSIEK